jgi:hypothetical protein
MSYETLARSFEQLMSVRIIHFPLCDDSSPRNGVLVEIFSWKQSAPRLFVRTAAILRFPLVCVIANTLNLTR